jgi:hypothetical protein
VRLEESIDKSRVCFSRQEDLSTEHFIELIGRRVEDCEAWERTFRSQGNLKEAEKIGRAKEQMLRSLKRLNDIKSRANK